MWGCERENDSYTVGVILDGVLVQEKDMSGSADYA